MTSALRWAAMRAILMFYNCVGQSHKTVSTDRNFWSERRAEADSNRGPSAYQPNALPLGQPGSPLFYTFLSNSFIRSAVDVRHFPKRCGNHLQIEWTKGRNEQRPRDARHCKGHNHDRPMTPLRWLWQGTIIMQNEVSLVLFPFVRTTSIECSYFSLLVGHRESLHMQTWPVWK